MPELKGQVPLDFATFEYSYSPWQKYPYLVRITRAQTVTLGEHRFFTREDALAFIDQLTKGNHAS